MSNLFQNSRPASANDNAFDLDALIASVFDVWFAPDGPLGRWACEAGSSLDAIPPANLLSLPAMVEPIVEQWVPLAAVMPDPLLNPLSNALPLIETAMETPFNWSDFQSGFSHLLGHVNELTDALEQAVQNSHSGEEFASSICTFVRDWLSGQTNAGATFTPDDQITQTPDVLGWLGGVDPQG